MHRCTGVEVLDMVKKEHKGNYGLSKMNEGESSMSRRKEL